MEKHDTVTVHVSIWNAKYMYNHTRWKHKWS